MKYQPAATDHQALVDEVRSVMAPARPVTSTAFQAWEHDWVRPAQAAGNLGRWRVLAPVLSGLAVIAVVMGLTLVGGSAPPPSSAGAPDSLPRFYVTINGFPPKETAIVHSTRTGRALTRVHISSPTSALALIAATRSDRVFYIVTSANLPGHRVSDTAILRLSLSANGRSAALTRVPVHVIDPTTPAGGGLPGDIVALTQGIAVSPDGRQLALLLNFYKNNGFHPLTDIEVVSLTGGHRPAIWQANDDQAFGWDPVWVNDRRLAFLWQDHFRGTELDYTERTAVRLLNTGSPSRKLLSSSVLVRGGSTLGLIEAAYAAPGGGPVIAALARNTPALGGKGTALVRLAAISPVTGRITKVFASRTLRYHTEDARVNDDYYYGVLGFDASGKDALVSGPRFGMISQGRFTPLPTGPGLLTAAAW
jgi:hypothetical protein